MTIAKIEAIAPAKVNLALHVLGKRPEDGYHLIESLVVFTDFGDHLSISASPTFAFDVSGPFANDVPKGGENLIVKAIDLLPSKPQTSIQLTKNIPVEAGLGGGSSDAATALQLLAEWGTGPISKPQYIHQLGADVPVCLHGQPAARVSGIGEHVQGLSDPLPETHLVLANPNIAVSTRDVFQITKLPPEAPLPAVPSFRSVIDFTAWLKEQRNDLEAAAIHCCGAITEVLSALRHCQNCLLARMSGSGATCFGIFTHASTAAAAATRLQRAHPNWWIVPTVLTHKTARQIPS